MAIGERLRLARRAAGLSQRELARKIGVSAMAISKYERGSATPRSDVLLRLARALNLRVDALLRPARVSVGQPAYRCRKRLPPREEAALLAQVQDWLERYLDIEDLLGCEVRFKFPKGFPFRITSLKEVEDAALELRKAWELGFDPIESLVDVLEDRGIKVGLVDGPDEFDALTLQAKADGPQPVIAIKRGLPGDRQRFSLAHELAHLLLQAEPGVDEEKVAHRFAGAFLVPEPVARAELGRKRRSLHLYELHMLKHKYGLSMQAWIHRARELNILPKAAAKQLLKAFRERGWDREEPGDPLPPEEPQRMQRLILRALEEDWISPSRAAELLGKPLKIFYSQESKRHADLPLPLRG